MRWLLPPLAAVLLLAGPQVAEGHTQTTTYACADGGYTLDNGIRSVSYEQVQITLSYAAMEAIAFHTHPTGSFSSDHRFVCDVAEDVIKEAWDPEHKRRVFQTTLGTYRCRTRVFEHYEHPRHVSEIWSCVVGGKYANTVSFTGVSETDGSHREDALAAHHKTYLTIARAEHAIVDNEVHYWRREAPKEKVGLRVGDCKRRSATVVRCGIEITAVFFKDTTERTTFLEHDDAILKGTRVVVRAVPAT